MSAPSSPGGISRVRASRSAATAASAPRPCAASMTGRRSRISPLAPGYCSRTPNSSPSGWRGDQLRGDRGDDQLDAERLGPGGQHGQGLRQAVRVGQEDAAAAGRPPGQRHRLGGRGRLVQQGGPGDRQRGQVLDEGLEGRAGPPGGPGRSPAGTGCRRCTRPGSPARCGGSPPGCACRSSPARSWTGRPCSGRPGGAARRAPLPRTARAAGSAAAGHRSPAAGPPGSARRARRGRWRRASAPARPGTARCGVTRSSVTSAFRPRASRCTSKRHREPPEGAARHVQCLAGPPPLSPPARSQDAGLAGELQRCLSRPVLGA